MINHINGLLIRALPTQIVINAGGIGYEILIPISMFKMLPKVGTMLLVDTHLHIREDAHILYGFNNPQDRDLFRTLINSVTGVGPKIAMNILGNVASIAQFEDMIAQGRLDLLSKIPGVGKKVAERLVMDLKDKVGTGGAPLPPGTVAKVGPVQLRVEERDAIQALEALGTRTSEAKSWVAMASAKLGADATVEQLVRAALKK